MFDDNNNPKSTPNMIPIVPNIIPWIKNIPTIWFLLAPSDMRIAISFSLFLMDINKDETILNAAITMTNIKIINITLFSLFIARKSDWYDWVQSFAYIVACLLLKTLVNSSASRGLDNWIRTSEIGKSDEDNLELLKKASKLT